MFIVSQGTEFAIVPFFCVIADAFCAEASFQTIGHVTPVAWAMDGFKNITVRLLGFESVLLPSVALAGYAMLFFLLAAWRFRKVSE